MKFFFLFLGTAIDAYYIISRAMHEFYGEFKFQAMPAKLKASRWNR